MKITKKSMLSGVTHTMDMDVTTDQMKRYELGVELTQLIFPNVTPNEREFLISGITPEEWTEAFGDE